jgi:hypothetical protein
MTCAQGAPRLTAPSYDMSRCTLPQERCYFRHGRAEPPPRLEHSSFKEFLMTAPANGHSHKSILSFGVAALLAMTAATAQVATSPTGIDDSGSYRHEVQSCLSGNTQQDRDTCLREARNAQADKQRGVLDNNQARFDANATARCDVLKGEDEAACKARVMGFGNTTGSVAGGGVLREVETVVLPPGSDSVTIEPKTSDPVVLVPANR